jgi:NAD(P)-dependent dehydrogenase (short-subunit alcohol dehydrogenase family)
MGSMDGRVAIVTGGSAGIGEATARALAAEGASVTVADVDEERGAEVVAAIQESGGRALFTRVDVRDEADTRAMVDLTVEAFGRLDVAFNNAGVESEPTPLPETTSASWDRTIAVNLTGVWRCMQAEIPRMLEAGGGSIVNCASIAGLVGFRDMAPYVASKHGVVGLTRTASLELAPRGIRVNAVCPGVIETAMVRRIAEEQPEMMAGIVGAHPVGRVGQPEEIAATVLWLCSDGAAFVTGQAIAVDGGYTTQ